MSEQRVSEEGRQDNLNDIELSELIDVLQNSSPTISRAMLASALHTALVHALLELKERRERDGEFARAISREWDRSNDSRFTECLFCGRRCETIGDVEAKHYYECIAKKAYYFFNPEPPKEIGDCTHQWKRRTK